MVAHISVSVPGSVLMALVVHSPVPVMMLICCICIVFDDNEVRASACEILLLPGQCFNFQAVPFPLASHTCNQPV